MLQLPADAPAPIVEAAAVIAHKRDDPNEFWRVLDGSTVPMVTLTGARRYTHANRAARLLIRRSLDEVVGMRADDFASDLAQMLSIWDELIASGSIAGNYEIVFPDGPSLEIAYWGLANALPGEHLFAFIPAGWPHDEFNGAGCTEDSPELTKRELEVLRLAAEGGSARRISEALMVSESTVKTHLANAYAKLAAPDRAAAVARAIRLGLID